MCGLQSKRPGGYVANLGMLSFPAVDEVVVRDYLEASREWLATLESNIAFRVFDA